MLVKGLGKIVALYDQKFHPIKVIHQSRKNRGFEVSMRYSEIVSKIFLLLYIALKVLRIGTKWFCVGFQKLGSQTSTY